MAVSLSRRALDYASDASSGSQGKSSYFWRRRRYGAVFLIGGCGFFPLNSSKAVIDSMGTLSVLNANSLRQCSKIRETFSSASGLRAFLCPLCGKPTSTSTIFFFTGGKPVSTSTI
ncbi:hypothetical protein COOONC_00081 [Cooperia oncophora]